MIGVVKVQWRKGVFSLNKLERPWWWVWHRTRGARSTHLPEGLNIGQNVIRRFPHVFNKFRTRDHDNPSPESGNLE